MNELKEKIIEIKEVSQSNYDGYKIKTTMQEISILIDNRQRCCEDWGYLSTLDGEEIKNGEYNEADFIGISIVDGFLNTKKLPDDYDEIKDYAIFVNIETSKGDIQFAVYNDHNGYYGHDVRIISNELTEEYVL